jgi:hypothetical protein
MVMNDELDGMWKKKKEKKVRGPLKTDRRAPV